MVNILNIIEFLISALLVQFPDSGITRKIGEGIDLSFWYFYKISDFGKMRNVNGYC